MHRAVRRILGVVHVQQAHRVVLQRRTDNGGLKNEKCVKNELPEVVKVGSSKWRYNGVATTQQQRQ